MTRGEVWWADIPGVGRRPVLLLTRDTALALLGGVVVAEITTQVRGIPTEVALDQRDGMPRASVVSFDNIHTISKRCFSSRITELSNAKLEEVCEALRYAVAC
jgi:mRNA interferase MazF